MRFLILLIAMLISACNTTTIELNSNPQGASVSATGMGSLGTTPTEIKYDEDSCPTDGDVCLESFYFNKSGYEPTRIERLIQGKHMIIHAYLQPLQSKLQVSVFPNFAKLKAQYQKKDGNWAQLSLSGKIGTILSLNNTAIWEGRDYLHVKLNAASPGYIPDEKKITIQRGEQQSIEIVLEEYAVVGQINSIPSGADVYEKSLGYLGRTPFSIRIPYDQLVRISPQRRQVIEEPIYLFLQIKKSGYQPISKPTLVGEIDESKKPVPFNISVHLSPIQKKQ